MQNLNKAGKGTGRSRDGAVPLNMFFVASENPFPASFTLVVHHEGVVYEEVLNGPASLLAPLVKKCAKTLKESEADILKKTAKLLEKQDRRLFGRALEDYLGQQKMTEPGLHIPAFVVDAIQYIIRHGLGATGLFRESGSQSNMKRIKDNLDKGELLSTQDLADVNDVAGALKLYVRELPEALCTFKLFSAFCDTLKLQDLAVRLDETRSLIQQLPLPNQTLLETLCSMLYIVSRNHVVNKMHVSNLALVFGPNLLYSDPSVSGNGTDLMRMQLDSTNVIGVVSFLIEHCEALFDDPMGKPPPLAFHARLLGHAQRVNLVVQTPDLSLVWSIDTDNVVRFTSASSLQFEGQLHLPHRVHDLCMLGPHALLATAVGVEVRDAQTGGIVQTIQEPSADAPQPVSHIVCLDSNLWAVRHAPVASGEATLLLDVYDTATWKRFHTIPIVDAPHDAAGGIAAVTHFFVAGSRLWLCLADGSIRVVDPQLSAVRKEASRGAFVVSSASTTQATWTAHADGIVTVWDHDRIQATRTLRDLGGEGEQINITKLAAFGSRVFGTVRDCVVAWDALSGQRVATAQGYANGKNTTIVPVYNSARKRFYAWSGSTDGSVCVWSMPQGGLRMAAPDTAALLQQYPTMRVLTRAEREALAHEQGVELLILPKSLGTSTHMPVAAQPPPASTLMQVLQPLAHAGDIGVAASLASAARGASSGAGVVPVAGMTTSSRRKPSGDNDSVLQPAAAVSAIAGIPEAAAAAAPGTVESTEPLSARKDKPIGAAPRPSGAAPAPAPALAADADERRKRAARRKSLAADKVSEFSAQVAGQLGNQPPPPPMHIDDGNGTAAPPGSPMPPRHRPAPPPIETNGTGDNSSPRTSSSLASSVTGASDEEHMRKSKRDVLSSPRKPASPAIKGSKTRSGNSRRSDVEIDINSDDVPEILKNLAAAQRGEGDEATRAMLQQLTLTGSMPALARHAGGAVAPPSPTAQSSSSNSGETSPLASSSSAGSKAAKRVSKTPSVKENKARKSLGSAELSAMLASSQEGGGGVRPTPPRHSSGHAKPKPPPPPLPAEIVSGTDNGSEEHHQGELPPAVVHLAPLAQAATVAAAVVEDDDDEMD